MKIGIVGAGFAAKFHYECYEKMRGKNLEVAGVTSLRKESRGKFAADRNLKGFNDVEGLIKAADVIDVCVPAYAHEEVIIKAAMAGKDIIVEKPLTGYFGPKGAGEEFRAGNISRKQMLKSTIESIKRIRKAVEKSGVMLCYAENFVYAPCIQKAREIIEKSNAQVLRMMGEESHSGSHSPVYGIWRYAGGGSLMGKGCHPLSAVLYLKRAEGLSRNKKPIRPESVSCRTHEITRLKTYQDKGFIRTDYRDVEDYGYMHIVFEDGTIADVFSSEIVLGGVYNWIEIFANNHRTRCNLSPVDMVNVYNPDHRQFKDIYLIEKITSKEGWVQASANENWSLGYEDEFRMFTEDIANKREPQSNLELAEDTIMTIYASYLSAEAGGLEKEVPKI